MSKEVETAVADAQRRALFACEVIVNRRLHDFSEKYLGQYSNDVAAERKAIEAEIAKIRRRIPAPPLVAGLTGDVAAASGIDAETVAKVLTALADLRPDVIALVLPDLDEDDDD